jgi:hypothetical protein
MPVFAEDVARDPQDFIVGNRFRSAHAPQFRAIAAHVPSHFVPDPTSSEKGLCACLWTNKRALANIRLASILSAIGLAAGSMTTRQVAFNLKEPRVMLRTSFTYCTLLVCGVLALACCLALADDGKGDQEKPIPSGTWEKKEAEPTLKFTGEDKLTIFPHGDNLDFQIDCSYTVTKDGLVKAKITRLGGAGDVVEKAKESVPVGLEFTFKWKLDGDKATLDELDGKDVEHVKERLEGEYTKKS